MRKGLYAGISPLFQRVTVAASMATSDKRKTNGNRKMRTKKESERKKESEKERNAEKAAKKYTKKKKAIPAFTVALQSLPPPSYCPPVGFAFVEKVEYFCCLSAFKRNSDGLESSNRPGPDSLASVASPPVFLESASPPPPSPSVASLSLCVSPVVGSRN